MLASKRQFLALLEKFLRTHLRVLVMINRTELSEIIIAGENSGIEFKRDNLRPEQLAKEFVALANFQGRRVLLGVEDEGTITGIQRDNLQEWLMDTVFGYFMKKWRWQTANELRW